MRLVLRLGLLRLARASTALLLVSLAFHACAPQMPEVPPVKWVPARDQIDPGPPSVQVPRGALGPHLVVGSSGALMVWAYNADSGTVWLTRPLGRDAKPTQPPALVAEAPSSTGHLTVQPFAGGAIGLSTSRANETSTIELVVFELDGSLRTSPSAVVRTPHEIAWVDVVSFERGGLLLWAVRTGRSAALYALPLTGFGQGEGEVVAVHSGATGWQARRAGDGAIVAVVTESSELEFLVLDEHARPIVENVAPGVKGVRAHVDIVDRGGEFLAVFAARHIADDQVFSLRLGPDGAAVEAPRLAVPPMGEQRPKQLLATPRGALYLVWESEQYTGSWLLAALRPDGSVLGPIVTLPVRGMLPPSVAVDDRGVVVLLGACASQGEPCSTNALSESASPGGAEVWLLSPELAFISRQHVAVDGQPADMAWGARCQGGNCYGLLARADGDRQVVAASLQVSMPQRQASLATPESRPAAALFPTLDSGGIVSTLGIRSLLAPPEPLVAVASAAGAGETLFTLSDFEPSTPYRTPKQPAPDGRLAPVRAVLRAYDLEATAGGGGLAPQAVISYRARSVGGLAAASQGDRNVVVWSALDPKVPQVFATLLIAGKAVTQRMLTRNRGEIRTVAVAPGLEQKWAVAWVDERGGAAAAHLMLVSEKLYPVTHELALHQGLEPSVVRLRAEGDELWALVQGRSVRGDDVGREVIVLRRFERKTMLPLGEPSRLLASDTPLLSVDFASGKRPAVIWIRDGTAEVALLGPQGRLIDTRQWLSTEGLVQIAMRCDASCRGVGAASHRGGSVWRAVELGLDTTTAASVIARSSDAAAAAVLPLIAATDDVLFYDTTGEGNMRLNYVSLDWHSQVGAESSEPIERPGTGGAAP